MYIYEFRILDEERRMCLINGSHELLIDTITVYRSQTRHYRSFLYVSALPDKPSGIYDITPDYMERRIHEYGYASEEVGFWNGRYLSIEEYQDGFTEINNEIVKLSGAEMHTRNLSPYNFFMSCQASVFNSTALDFEMKQICQDLLAKKVDILQIAERVEELQFPERLEPYFLNYW